jgi:hypothetical protein
MLLPCNAKNLNDSVFASIEFGQKGRKVPDTSKAQNRQRINRRG